MNTAASKLFEGNLKEFLLFFEGNLGQKKEKIRNFPVLEMETLLKSGNCDHQEILYKTMARIFLFLFFSTIIWNKCTSTSVLGVSPNSKCRHVVFYLKLHVDFILSFIVLSWNVALLNEWQRFVKYFGVGASRRGEGNKVLNT